ncbi:MAG: dihydroorotase [Ferrimicrobium sp.]
MVGSGGLVLVGGVLLFGGEIRRVDVRVADEVIVAIGDDVGRPGDRVMSCEGCVIAPGFIDLHAHLRWPSANGESQPEAAVEAALLGGFVTLVAMANTDPPIDSVGRLRAAQERYRGLAVEVVQAATVSVDRAGERLVDMVSLAGAGAVLFSDDGAGVQNAEMMRRALLESRVTGVPIAQHAVDDSLFGSAVMNDSLVSARLGLVGGSEVAESVMVARDIELVKATAGVLHVMHVSSRESINLVRQARREGLRVSAEVTPHHLLLTDGSCSQADPRFKVNPPLRSLATQMALVSAVLDGSLEVIATDYAPHPVSAKRTAFGQAAFGIAGLAEAFSAAWTALRRAPGTTGEVLDSTLPSFLSTTEWFRLRCLVEALTTNAARVIGRQVGFEVGAAADLVILDPNARATGPLDPLNVGDSAYSGVDFSGSVQGVLRRGELMVWGGERV